MSTLQGLLGASSGGGLKPKYQEFLTSGTFTPSQALIDAGGVITVFIVGGGASGNGAGGGEVISKNITLNDLNAITITIGAGGFGTIGSNSSFGALITALGGQLSSYTNPFQDGRLGAGWAAASGSSSSGSAGNGGFGYGAGSRTTTGAGGIRIAKINSGQGASSGYDGGSGYCHITWSE